VLSSLLIIIMSKSHACPAVLSTFRLALVGRVVRLSLFSVRLRLLISVFRVDLPATDSFQTCGANFIPPRWLHLIVSFPKIGIIAPPIGRPIKVRGSCRNTAFTESARRFTARIPIASRRPHIFCRASPTPAQPHPVPTTSMSRTERGVPICWNPTCASGFKRHTKSSPTPGTSSAATVIAQAVAPNAKNATSTFIPTAKRRDMQRSTM